MAGIDRYKEYKARTDLLENCIQNYGLQFIKEGVNTDKQWFSFRLRNGQAFKTSVELHEELYNIINDNIENMVAEAMNRLKMKGIQLKAEAMKEAKEILDELSA